MPKKKSTSPPETPLAEELVPQADSFDEETVSEMLETLPDSDVTDLYDMALQVMKDALTGLRVRVKTKQPQLNKGQVAEWRLDTTDGEVWVYQRAPDVKLAQFIAQQKEGRPGTKGISTKATTVVFQACYPGHDAEIDSYLATLSDEVISKYDFSADVLESIKRAKEHKDAS